MKPILTWFEDLPEPYASEFIPAYYNSPFIDTTAKSLDDAILLGVNWADFPTEYVHNVYKRAIAGEFDKK